MDACCGWSAVVSDAWGEQQNRAHNLASFARPLKDRRSWSLMVAPAGMDLFRALQIAESVLDKQKADK